MKIPTPRDIELVTDNAEAFARLIWENEGHIDPVLITVELVEVDGEEVHRLSVLPPNLTRRFFGSGEDKDKLMVVIGAMLSGEAAAKFGLPHPDIVVQVCEAWSLHGSSRDPIPSGSIAEHPDRGEVIAIVVHTAFGSTSRMLPIDPQTRKLTTLPRTDRMKDQPILGRMQVADWMEPPAPDQRH